MTNAIMIELTNEDIPLCKMTLGELGRRSGIRNHELGAILGELQQRMQPNFDPNLGPC